MVHDAETEMMEFSKQELNEGALALVLTEVNNEWQL